MTGSWPRQRWTRSSSASFSDRASVTGTACLIDTAVVLHAVGGDHPLREGSRQIVAAAGAGKLELHASVEMVQEFVFHRMRRGDRLSAVRQARDVAGLCILHDFDRGTLQTALELIAGSGTLGGRDAVHAATAVQHGLSIIISPDQAFDNIPGLRRIDPTTPTDRIK